MGLENRTVLIRDERNVMLPSNFTGVTIIEYESTPPEFPTAIAAVIAAQIEQEPRGNE